MMLRTNETRAGDKVVIARIVGGLGNQMFQYAAARALADATGGELCLDLSWFRSAGKDVRRRLGLEDLCTRWREATDAELAAAWTRAALPKRVLRRAFGWMPRNDRGFQQLTESKWFVWDQRLESLKPPVVLSGYWQSWKYFRAAEHAIRQDLALKMVMPRAESWLEDAVRDERTVAIHVRRGDYVSNASAAAYFGAKSRRYYERAVRLVETRIETPKYIVFTDDEAWSRGNLSWLGSVRFVPSERRSEVYDLFLMSQCQGKIIANSSYSWWAAWLGYRSGRTVIAPRRWAIGSAIDPDDILPPEWLRADDD